MSVSKTTNKMSSANIQSGSSLLATFDSATPHQMHDERVEAACFDAKVKAEFDSVSDTTLDMSAQVKSYLGNEPPQLPSAIRLLVHAMGDLRGKTILDLGCGTGDLSVILAKRGGRVTGVDVSLASIEIATRRARINRVSDEMTATVMSAYSLAFADGTFDVVAGKAVLHHLDLVRSRDEILRVLKPGGRGCFIEPILFSRFLGLLRNIVPVPVDRDSPDERQLSMSDVELFSQKFGTTTLKEIGLISSRLERFFPQIPWWLRLLFRFDSRALHYSPLLRKYASTMLMVVTK